MTIHIATALYSLVILVALTGFWLLFAVVCGWFVGKDQEKPQDMLSDYYEDLEGFHPPSKTFPDGNYHSRWGYVPIKEPK